MFGNQSLVSPKSVREEDLKNAAATIGLIFDEASQKGSGDELLPKDKTFGKRSMSVNPGHAKALLGQQSIQFLEGHGSEL